eukprot:1038307-Prymnesium_polylepis.1
MVRRWKCGVACVWRGTGSVAWRAYGAAQGRGLGVTWAGGNRGHVGWWKGEGSREAEGRGRGVTGVTSSRMVGG